jgi:hypothetical protein
MAETVNRGPTVNAGSLMDGRVEPLDGPSIEYQGMLTCDPRQSPMAKDIVAAGVVKGFYNSPQFIIVDAIPSITSTTTVAASQAPSTTTGVKLNLTTAVIGTAANVPVWTPGIPIIPTNTTVPVTVSALDFGFATGSTTANSSTVQTDATQFQVGQWIVIGGAGSGSSTNVALIAQVASIASLSTLAATTIYISPVAASTMNHAPIGQGNLYNQFLPPATQFGPSSASANAAEPYRVAGWGRMFDPAQGVCRALTVTAASITAGTTSLLVSGYDIYGVPMTELITASGTTTVSGNKAFKYVTSIATQSTATTVTNSVVTIGVSNVVGLNLYNNKWEYLDIFFNGGFAITNTGWTSGTAVVATQTTGDVRGTQNLTTVLVGGASGSAASGAGADGVKRLTIVAAIPQQNMINATPLNSVSLFGTTQV